MDARAVSAISVINASGVSPTVSPLRKGEKVSDTFLARWAGDLCRLG